ncbi:MAG: hypothetical protein K5901_00010 [Bacteroidales bacterium]|nr:hypothetical protein [Bacteroidales bacterium]
MTPQKDKYQFAKKEILQILIAIFALILVSLVYYFHIRKEALHTAREGAPHC